MAMSAVERAHEALRRFEGMSDSLSGFLPSSGAVKYHRYDVNRRFNGTILNGGFTPGVLSSFQRVHCSGIGDSQIGCVPLDAQDELHLRLHAADAIRKRLQSGTG